MQIALSSWSLCALVECLLESGFLSSGNAFVFLLSGFLLSASSMTGFIAFIPYGAMLCWLVFRSKRNFEKWTVVIAMGSLFAFFALGLFYLSTLLNGVGGAKAHAVGIANLAYPVYEFMGFCGLGVDRLTMRSLLSQGLGRIVTQFGPYFLFLVALLGAYLFLVWAYIRSKKKQPYQSILLHIGSLIPAIFLIALVPAFVVRFPLWGRHISAVFPCCVLVTGLMIEEWNGSVFKWITVSALFALLLFSSLRLRFDSEYAREDFRSATAVAKEALGKNQTVWWYGMPYETGYYKLPISSNPDETNKALLIVEYFGSEDVQSLSAPDWLIVSERTESTHHPNWLYHYIENQGYQKSENIKGFSVYRKTKDSAGD
jgi:hypothetical protein